MTTAEYTLLFSVIGFLIVHLCAAIWFASRVNTEMREMRRAMVNLEVDVRGLLTFDKRIAVLEERVQRNEQDIREAWKLLPPIKLRKYVFYAKLTISGFVTRQSGNFQKPTSASLQPVSFSLATS